VGVSACGPTLQSVFGGVLCGCFHGVYLDGPNENWTCPGVMSWHCTGALCKCGSSALPHLQCVWVLWQDIARAGLSGRTLHVMQRQLAACAWSCLHAVAVKSGCQHGV
jgi:hypothetical protein